MRLDLVLPTAVALAMDACAVSASFGARARHLPWRAGVPMAASFGLWQAGMYLGGSFVGAGVVGVLSSYGRWFAAAVLLALAVRMGWEAWHHEAEARAQGQGFPRGRVLWSLSLATSVDAAAAGLSLGLVSREKVAPALLVGGVTAVLALAAVLAGRRLGHAIGRLAEAFGAVVLAVLAGMMAFG